MWRLVFNTTLAGVLGSVVATFILVIWAGGTGWPDPARFVAAWLLGTVPFTVLGAFLLLAFQELTGIESRRAAASAMMLFATIAGAMMLAVPTQTSVGAALGGFYGFCTAVALLSLERLLGAKPSATA